MPTKKTTKTTTKKTTAKKTEEPKAEEKKEKVQTEVSTDVIPNLDKHPAQTDKELNDFFKAMEKQYGDGCIASASEILHVKKVPTKNLLLDILTEGGLPQGSITLFFGEESSGKTMQTFLSAAVFTSQKIPVLYICSEGDIDKNWAKILGNDLDYLHIVRPPDLEKAIDICDVAVRSRQFGMVVFDSVTAAIPQDVIEKETIKDHYAVQARRNGKLVAKVTSGLQPADLKDPDAYNPTVVVLIAHVREKVGIVYGNPETIPGGHALKHHSAYIVKFKRGQKLKLDKDIVGREMRIAIDKAKFSRPLVSGVTEIRFDPPRLNNFKVLMTYAKQFGIIDAKGPYFYYGELKAQGVKEFGKVLKDNPKALKEIRDQVIKVFSGDKDE